MSNGDIRVFGLVAGTHVLEDIGMDVPHGVEVIIPAEKASRSKDLYKAIGQKCIFQLPSAPAPTHAAPGTHIREDILQERNQFLEQRNKQLEEEIKQLRADLGSARAQQESLDTILKAIRDVKVPAAVYVNGGPAVAQKPQQELADGSAPQFIPNEIAPKDAETRIDMVRQETADSEVSGAAGKLRKMRRGDG
jgi:hypothetical protein